MKGILKRLAKWIVKHGKEELEKEVDRRVGQKGDDRPFLPRPPSHQPPGSF